MIDVDKDNKIILIDDEGKEKEFEIFFTFEAEDTDKKYVFYYEADVEDEVEIEMFVSGYDDEGNLFEIEDGEEADMVEEVYNTFIEDNEIEDEA